MLFISLFYRSSAYAGPIQNNSKVCSANGKHLTPLFKHLVAAIYDSFIFPLLNTYSCGFQCQKNYTKILLTVIHIFSLSFVSNTTKFNLKQN